MMRSVLITCLIGVIASYGPNYGSGRNLALAQLNRQKAKRFYGEVIAPTDTAMGPSRTNFDDFIDFFNQMDQHTTEARTVWVTFNSWARTDQLTSLSCQTWFYDNAQELKYTIRIFILLDVCVVQSGLYFSR